MEEMDDHTVETTFDDIEESRSTLSKFVENKAIRSAFHYANKHIIDICRNTAKVDLFKIFLTEKASMRNELCAAPGRIGLTTDLWTSIATDGCWML